METVNGLTIRPMRTEDDLDAELDLRHRAFGPADMTREQWLAELRACIADARLFGVWDGDWLVGAARFYEMRQWWHGRAVPMAGIAGVKVAPEVRGRGVGRALMRVLLAALSERGYPLSVLYPTTAHLYRSLGWEIGGGHYLAQMPARSLTSLLPADPHAAWSGQPAEVPVRRAGPADADEVLAVLGGVHARMLDLGPSTRDAESLRRWLARPEVFAYLAPDGFLGYGWNGTDQELMVHVLQASSGQTVRALWGVVASHASVARAVRACVGPDDPVGWLTAEAEVKIALHEPWMLRVVSPAAAIEARGFPATARASVPMVLADPELPAQAGAYTLAIENGRGALVRGVPGGGLAPSGSVSSSPAASAPVSLGPRGFAALYAGVPVPTLRRAGLMTGGDERTDAELSTAFAGRPFTLDYF